MMRLSTVAMLAISSLLTLLACILPFGAAVSELWASPASSGQSAQLHSPLELLITTTAWALVIAVIAMVLGWLPGRAISSVAGRHRWFAILCLAPICLPAYTVFWCWWQAWPSGSFIHQWVIEEGLMPEVRQATLLLGLVCWSWPLVAWCVAATRRHGDERLALLALDGGRIRHRLMSAWRSDCRGLLIGGAIVGLLTFNNTTCFDLAEVFTIGNELRAMQAMGASSSEVVVASLPTVGVTVAVALALWLLLFQNRASQADRQHRSVSLLLPALIWIASIAVPTLLIARSLSSLLAQGGSAQVTQFLDFYGRDLLGSAAIAIMAASLVTIIGLSLSFQWDHRSQWVRLAAHGQALLWVIAAALPATLIAVGIEAAYNRPSLAVDSIFYDSSLVLLLGLTSRFAVLGVILGRWLASRESRALRDASRLDDVMRSLRAYATAWRPRLLRVACATFAISIILVLAEIPLTAALRSPRVDVITPAILNAMHYQQPHTVMLAITCFLAVALAVAVFAVLLLMPRSRRPIVRCMSGMGVMISLITFSGCSGQPEDGAALDVTLTFGTPGRGPGQMSYPRALAVDRVNDRVYVVDKTARIQQFTLDGEFQRAWEMPAKENGKPTGLNVGPDGNVYVADTHYHQIIKYAPDGTELLRFGSYGEEPGEFIYTTDVEFSDDGLLYVSEYGGNDRIQVFSRDGDFRFSFGSFGTGIGEFNRPQSMVFSPDKSELYIADACNHRIVVTDPAGNVQRVFGEPGRERGQLAYPYDLTFLPDGTLLVVEFGNNRLQRFSSDGQALGVHGRLGFGTGELQYPWGVDGTSERVFVLDSGNNRVQMLTRFN